MPAKLFFIAFPTSYLAERGFGVVSQILTKARNRLNVVERGDLRLRLITTTITPDIEKLIAIIKSEAHIDFELLLSGK